MKLHYNFQSLIYIRLGHALSLIFFALTFFFSCSAPHNQEISILWERNRASAVAVPRNLLDDTKLDSIGYNLVVHLKGQQASILGDYRFISNRIIFTPAVPFTPGKEYEVVYKQQLLKQFFVPFPDSVNAPEVVAVFPSTDTLPENVLKLYINFSGPMREGQALKHISLVNDKGDTLPDTFLNLQPELWNTERNVLTIWFDPGRIKRDLIPNLKMGNPLVNGRVYTLHISSDWKDVQGLALKKNYSRQFIIKGRDSVSPDPEQWQLVVPTVNTKDPLRIYFRESLDYYLLKEVISILNEEDEPVAGSLKILNVENEIAFYPESTWAAGKYRLKVASKLEDLAGNNINRLFEKDNSQPGSDKDLRFFQRYFSLFPAGNR